MRIQTITSANEPVEGVYPEGSSLEAFPSMMLPGLKKEQPTRLFFRPEAVEQLFRFINWDEKTLQNRVEQAGIMYGMTYKHPASALPASPSDSASSPPVAPPAASAPSALPADDGLQPAEHAAAQDERPGQSARQETDTRPRPAQAAPSAHPADFTWSEVYGIIPSRSSDCSPAHINITADDWQQMAVELDRLNAARVQRGEAELQQVGWFHTHPNRLEPVYSSLDITLQRVQAANKDRYGAVFNPHRRIFAVYSGPDSRPERGALLLSPEQARRYNMQELKMADPVLYESEPVVKLKKRSPLTRMLNDTLEYLFPDQYEPEEAPPAWNFDPVVARMLFYADGRWLPYKPKDSVLASSVARLFAIRDAFGVGDNLSILAAWQPDRHAGYHLVPVMAWDRTGPQPNDVVIANPKARKYCIVRFIRRADLEQTTRDHRNHPERTGGMRLAMITENHDVYIA